MTQTLFSDSARKHNAQHQAVDSLVSQQKRPTATGLEREGARSIAELPSRFQAKISVHSSGCWLWTGYIDRAGYGQVRHKGKLSTPHRAVFEILCGTVTAEDVDHLCRVRHCVNPAHLEPVTHRENMRRGNAPAGLNARKTHCKRGHEFTAENTIPHGKGNRNCRACLRVRRGSPPPRRRLTAEELTVIRAWLATGTQRTTIAAQFGVSKSLITLIAQGKRYREVAS